MTDRMKLKPVKFEKQLDYDCETLECQKKKVLELLRLLDFPLTERPNVLRKGQTGYRGFVLGKIHTRGSAGRGVMLSLLTQKPKYRELYLNAIKLMKDYDKNFKFTTIQFNKNQRAAKHKDANNVGASYIIGLGDYEGGELIVYDINDKNPKKINIKNKFYKFDGSLFFHETARFKGERYTLVFFKN